MARVEVERFHMSQSANPPTDRSLFLGALDQPTPDLRAAYLSGACVGDAKLRGQVEAMLAEHFAADSFMAGPAIAPDRTAPTPASLLTEGPGTRIGRYKLLQRIGEGGMGVVYMAEQEEPVRRRVALKIIKLGMDTRQVVARFEAERQALAMMDHPNIARVLDGGATETGRPYFVMELVQGVPITEFCDQNKLPANERMGLFIQVCQAIQSAHQKGIIHRDIKPSNVLVTLHHGESMPKVIDFGIAKATNQKLTEKTLFTNHATMIGTPAYMSPEQAELTSMDVDTRTDVYSLGVLLYELLTGSTPFPEKRLRSLGYGEMQRVIVDEEPQRPSTRLSTLGDELKSAVAKNRGGELGALIHLLRGDLDWVVMRCLEKDRRRRYDTPNELVADIERHLKNEPIIARPPTLIYRVQKLVRRNQLVIAAGTAVAAALVIGIVASGWQAYAANRARNAEKQHRLAAEAAQNQAESAQQAEQRERLRADVEKTEARRILYVAQMNLAHQAWEQNQLGRLRQLLEETQESPNRGFEWYYWQQQAHRHLKTLRGHLEDVTSAVFFPDGKRIVTSSWDQTAKVWDAASGRELLSLKGHGAPIWCVAISPDGQRIVTGSWDQTAIVWDAANGRNLATLKGHSAPIRSVAFSPDSQKIVTGSWDQTAKVWEAAGGGALLTLAGTSGNVGSVAFSPDGQRIVTGLGDSTAKVWEAANGRELLSLKGHQHQVRSVAFSPDGQRIVTGSDDQTAKVWGAATGNLQLTLHGQGAEIYCVAFSPDGRQIATGGADNTAKLWDAASGGELLTLKGHSAAIWSVAFSPDGRRVLTGSWDQTAKVWEPAIGEGLIPLMGHANTIRAMAFSPDGQWIVTASEDPTAKVWEASSGRPLRTLGGHTAGIGSMAFSPDGQRIVTGSDDQTAKIWEAASGRELLPLKGHKDRISCVAFSPNGQQIVSGSWDQTAKIWEAASGRVLRTLEGNRGRISSVAFSPDGQSIVTISGDQASVWEMGSGRKRLTFNGHRARIMSLVFSPDGQRIVTGSWDNTAKVWEAASGRELLTLNGHNGGISSVAISPDGQRILTGSDDNTAKVWEAVSGRELLTLKGHNGGIASVAFSPDGQQIMTGSRDQMVKRWETASAMKVDAWRKEDDTATEHLAVLGRERAETAGGDRLHRAQDPGAIGHVTFTKWGISLPANPPSFAGVSLAGVVGGDVGSGRLAGEILSDGLFVNGFWLGHARYEFYGEKHSFIADIHVTENVTKDPVTAVITGVVTQGWRKGAHLTGEYTAMPVCPITTPGNVFGTLCYQVTLQIDGESEPQAHEAGPQTDKAVGH